MMCPKMLQGLSLPVLMAPVTSQTMAPKPLTCLSRPMVKTFTPLLPQLLFGVIRALPVNGPFMLVEAVKKRWTPSTLGMESAVMFPLRRRLKKGEPLPLMVETPISLLEHLRKPTGRLNLTRASLTPTLLELRWIRRLKQVINSK